MEKIEECNSVWLLWRRPDVNRRSKREGMAAWVTSCSVTGWSGTAAQAPRNRMPANSRRLFCGDE